MPRAQTPTIAECVSRYMQSKGHMAESTVTNQGNAIRRFARGVGVDRPIGYLTALQVERYFIRELRGLQASSFNKEYQRIRHFLTYCMRHGWVTKDLLVDVHKRTPARREKRRVPAVDLRRLLDFCDDPRNRGLMATCTNTGLRASEIERIQIGHVNLIDEDVYVWRSKSQRDDRVPMTPMLAEELRRWLTAYTTELGAPLEDTMRLFPNRLPPKWLHSVDGVQQRERFGQLDPARGVRRPHLIVQEVLRDYGWTNIKYQGVHTIRRSVARAYFDDLVRRGVRDPLGVVQALLGHKQRATTEEYIGLDVERRRRDETLRQDFLPLASGDNVVPIRAID